MGLFSKKRGSVNAFWRTLPIRSNDPAVLQQYGINCMIQSDGPGMMQVGWALWQSVGMHQQQADTFLRDGYRAWVAAAQPSVEARLAFLTELFDGLTAADLKIPDDIYAAPREHVQPIATFYEARCWSGSELVEVLSNSTDPRRPEYEQRVFDAAVRTHPAFVPPRSMVQARAYAAAHGLPNPFQTA